MNKDDVTVESFGNEWSRYDQSVLSDEERKRIFDEYFLVFPWESLPENSVGVDIGCGSGRWAALVAQKVGELHCVDASADALAVAKRNLAQCENVSFHHASVDAMPIPDGSMDFAYSLGVLHHVPDTAGAIRDCVKCLKPGAPFLVYLYYAFDNRPAWFRLIWKCSDVFRSLICRLPENPKSFFTDLIALTVYWPLSRFARILEFLGVDSGFLPLSYYKDHSFYTLRTDSRDRFGTPLEQRFTLREIEEMLREAGLSDIRHSSSAPYWCVIGFKR